MAFRIIPAIMSGGAGTRLWPLSTEDKPKQFHALSGTASLFAETALRLHGAANGVEFAPPIALCGSSHVAGVRAAFAEAGIAPSAILVEPAPRNTAAVAATAALAARELDPEALVLLAPADHVVENPSAFHAAIARAAPFARDRIVTFGIKPSRAATGYGYIKLGDPLSDGVFGITSFKEKPNAAIAQSYVDEGNYCWNSGMFLFSPSVLLKEFDASANIRERVVEAWSDSERADGEIRLGSAYANAPAIPLDVAVMEKTVRAAVVPCDIGWTDIGAWDELWRLWPQDEAGNAARGPVAAVDAANNLLLADGVKICVAGVENLIVVATADAVLIVPRDRAQDVKALRDLASKL